MEKSLVFQYRLTRRLELPKVMNPALVLNGNNLNIEDLYALVKNPDQQIVLDPLALEQVAHSESMIRVAADKNVIYGVNTGFGPMANRILAKDQLAQLQLNLIRSHAVGIGDPVPTDFVLAAMVVRLNTLLKGGSGVSVDLVNRYAEFINHRIIPVVPEHGSVGASGDLVQLAHIALGLIGEGEVYFEGQQIPAKQACKISGISDYVLKPKEGLALINGTSFMTGVGAIVVYETEQLLKYAIQTAATSLEVINGFDDAISEKLQSVRPHPGQIHVGLWMRRLLADSSRLRKRENLGDSVIVTNELQQLPEAIQEIYSLRCVPQILGPVYEALCSATRTIIIELNSTTDNPITVPETGHFLHGGNFHGDYVSYTMDTLKIALVRLSQLSERRINFFLNERVNKRFPPFLNMDTPGLTLGLQALQFVATSTVADNQSLAFPHYIHTVPTNGDNQDIVSMGSDSAFLAYKVVENTRVILAVEFVTIAQAIDLVGDRQTFSSASQDWHTRIRQIIDIIKEDRFISNELNDLVLALKTNKI